MSLDVTDGRTGKSRNVACWDGRIINFMTIKCCDLITAVHIAQRNIALIETRSMSYGTLSFYKKLRDCEQKI